MMTMVSENVGRPKSYQESLDYFVKYVMENPGRGLTVDLRLPDGYGKTKSDGDDIETMNDHLKSLKNYNKFNLVKDGNGTFMSRITYGTEQTLAYADVISLNGALGEISSAISRSENSRRYG